MHGGIVVKMVGEGRGADICQLSCLCQLWQQSLLSYNSLGGSEKGPKSVYSVISIGIFVVTIGYCWGALALQEC